MEYTTSGERNENSAQTIIVLSTGSDLSIEQIYQHFSQFGGIKSLTMSLNDDTRYVFIVFENVQSAQASVATPMHEIDQKTVKVCLNENFASFINIDLSLIPPDHKSPNHILNKLPDECLIEIFEYLHVKDLCTTGDTCTKFRAISKDIFTKRFSKVEESSYGGMNLKTLAKLFRNFGTHMKSFEMDCNSRPDIQEKHVELFFRHCAVAGNALTELTMTNLSDTIITNYLQPLQLLCGHLKFLKISKGGEISELLRNCNELTDLWLSLVSCPSIYELYFPKLETLFAYLYNATLVANNDNLGRFIRLHPKLKSIHIPLHRQMETTIFCDIASHLEHLEELSFMDMWLLSLDRADENFTQLAQLKFLRRLHLNCSSIPLDGFFNALVLAKTPIEDLCLQSLILSPSIAQSLSMMNKVEKLKFRCLIVEGGRMMNVVEGMPHLKHLFVGSTNEIVTIDDVKSIVNRLKESILLHFYDDGSARVINRLTVRTIAEAVKRRDNGIKLDIAMKGQWNVSIRFVKQFRKWVNIRKI